MWWLSRQHHHRQSPLEEEISQFREKKLCRCFEMPWTGSSRQFVSTLLALLFLLALCTIYRLNQSTMVTWDSSGTSYGDNTRSRPLYKPAYQQQRGQAETVRDQLTTSTTTTSTQVKPDKETTIPAVTITTKQQRSLTKPAATKTRKKPEMTVDIKHRATFPSVSDTMATWRHKWFSKLSSTSESSRQRNFTIQMLTYNRIDTLPLALEYYYQSPLVDRIIVQWNNVDHKPTAEFYANISAIRSKIFIEVQRENKLTNRMQLSQRVRTSCVLMVDDDQLVDLDDLHYGFEVWKKYPQHLVGFYPRAHSYNATTDRYRYVPRSLGNGSYSLILTGLVFVHRLYYRMFSEVLPPSVYHLIDSLTNCEDIVMNVFITLLLEPAPAGRLVWGQIRTLKSRHSKGLWLQGKHFQERDHCMDSLLHSYGGHRALKYSKISYRRPKRKLT